MEENRTFMVVILLGAVLATLFFVYREDYIAGSFTGLFTAWFLFLIIVPGSTPTMHGVNEPTYRQLTPVSRVYRLTDVDVTPAPGVADPLSLANIQDQILNPDPENPILEQITTMYEGGSISVHDVKDGKYPITSVKQTTRVKEVIFELVERREVVTNPEKLDPDQKKDKVTYSVTLLIPFRSALTDTFN